MKLPNPLIIALSVSLLVVLAAGCGGGKSSSPAALLDKGSSLLSEGDFAAASKKFEEAIDALVSQGEQAAAADLKRARLSLARCEISSGKADQGVQSFEELVVQMPGEVDWKDFKSIGILLEDQNQPLLATNVYHEARQKFPEQETVFLEHIEALKKKSEQDPKVVERLKALGYAK